MKKYFPHKLTLLAILASLLFGCTPTVQAIPLIADDPNTTLEFIQNDVNIPISGSGDQWSAALKPESFTMKLKGDNAAVSVMAVKSAEIIQPLQRSSKSLVTISGTGSALALNDLFLSDQPLETYQANANNLQNVSYFSLPKEQAVSTAAALKDRFGIEPLILISGRSYLFSIPNLDKMFTVKTINGNTLQNGESIVLVIFIENKFNDPIFYALNLVTVNLKFQE